MTALAALKAVVPDDPNLGDGDDGPPDTDLLALFARVLALVGRRGPIFQAAIDRAFEQALVEHETEETEK